MVSPTAYFREVVRELKKVTWPSRKQTINKTTLVIAISILLAIYLGGLDFIFQKLAEALIK
ncbi:MAG: preprotein translocase subunit SecE [Candidatus Pacebacteria bacterium]|jgi:preprotein translocase subunit SecE|nr:preprotein translocase subunit SecE [Candidatus Paceibacterota bacterium]MBT3511801.1 preprotein translocase subunit SecE [Candidatus Paceibacterota bacterium]MBT4005125.1 preprotein translocase subunit SecE [Candidatus Paceibacterota bacterium]MBT4681233.1 preprotein translocase subunit SecE [Candidatus Paceibacterota bacterium]MBT6898806.1 preprotein translocase subunit SecE [Candidatus Paceibacterota bacterium]